jgi:nicotinamide-nucleotide amidase
MPSSTPIYTPRTSETLRDICFEIILLLKTANETIGVAESLTGGLIMSALTSIEGSSAVFRGGVVSYATPLKQKLLSVDANLVLQHGVIHEEVAQQMAEGAREVTTFDGTPTTWGLSTTGVAGPGMQDGKPVGMVFIGIAGGEMEGCMSYGPLLFKGSREQVREATVMEALFRLRETLVARRQ